MWKVKLLGWFRDLDRILRGDATRPAALERADLDVSARGLAIVLTLLAMGYGMCMGTYAIFRGTSYGEQLAQFLATTLKLPLLFFLTMAITLPSLYVFNVIFGSRLTLPAMVRLLLASLGVNLAVLASLGPIVAFFSVSTENYSFMVLLNVAVMAGSGVFGLMFLLQTLNRMVLVETRKAIADEQHIAAAAESAGDAEQKPETITAEIIEPGAIDVTPGQQLVSPVKLVFRVWFFVFGVVGAQMGWVLRPFIGNPNEPFQLFRQRNSNVFEAIWQSFLNLFA